MGGWLGGGGGVIYLVVNNCMHLSISCICKSFGAIKIAAIISIIYKYYDHYTQSLHSLCDRQKNFQVGPRGVDSFHKVEG